MESAGCRSHLATSRMSVILLGIASSLLLGCNSSTSKDDPQQNTSGENTLAFVTLLEVGSEPFQSLSVLYSAGKLYSTVASATETIDFNSTLSTDTVSASYDLSANLTLHDNGVSLQLTPILKSYSIAPDKFPTTINGRWEFTYTQYGALTDSISTDSTGFTRYNTLGVFAVPNLILPVPDVAVGKGAIWTFQSAEPEGVVTNTVTVSEINNSFIKIDLRANVQPSDLLASTRYTTTATSTYDTNTLMLIETEFMRESDIEGAINVNGQPSELKSTVRNDFTLSEVSP